MSDLSTFLFASPSFGEGMGRMFDFGNTLTEFNRSESADEADRRALYADFAVVGEEILAEPRSCWTGSKNNRVTEWPWKSKS